MPHTSCGGYFVWIAVLCVWKETVLTNNLPHWLHSKITTKHYHVHWTMGWMENWKQWILKTDIINKGYAIKALTNCITIGKSNINDWSWILIVLGMFELMDFSLKVVDNLEGKGPWVATTMRAPCLRLSYHGHTHSNHRNHVTSDKPALKVSHTSNALCRLFWLCKWWVQWVQNKTAQWRDIAPFQCAAGWTSLTNRTITCGTRRKESVVVPKSRNQCIGIETE